MKFSYIFILIAIILNSCGVREKKINNLKTELSEILKSDQGIRELFSSNLTKERRLEIFKIYNISEEDWNTRGWKIADERDSLNLIKVEKIINKFGYPGKDLVGKPLNKAVWYVIQHSKLETIERYFPLIEKAGLENQIYKTEVAMMNDRMLMYQGKEQIYGTQGAGRLLIDPKTKAEHFTNFIWPIKDYNNVNNIRKEIGFEMTMEEYAKAMGIDYSKRYTLEEIKELTKK